jgi:D-serine deaminase-like pyridoxal phosphate-dependent protein
MNTYTLPASLREQLLSPALIVYMDMVRANVQRVIDAVGGDPDRWRPHIKTIKLAPVFLAIADAGVRNFKCATTREASCLLETLDAAGIETTDVLLAHPIVGPNLEQLGRIASARPAARVSVLCEDPDAVEAIPPGLGVFVDINPGMNRTGVPVDRTAQIAGIAAAAGDRFRGVHFYEGHLAGLEARKRRQRAFACYDKLMTVLADLADHGNAVPEVITSGTPTFPDAIAYEPLSRLTGTVHRVSPGTAVLGDTRAMREIPDVGLVPAAVVFARVVSHPADGLVTCDAGSKSIAADAGDPCAESIGQDGLEALKPSEEHLPFRVNSGVAPPRGTELLLVPRHVCPTVNLAEKAVLIEDGLLSEIVEVIGRAHDVIADEPATVA